jgi:hypothetical protein
LIQHFMYQNTFSWTLLKCLNYAFSSWWVDFHFISRWLEIVIETHRETINFS